MDAQRGSPSAPGWRLPFVRASLRCAWAELSWWPASGNRGGIIRMLDVDVRLARVQSPVLELLRTSGVTANLGGGSVFPRVEDEIAAGDAITAGS
jgi:hypothetical protein